MQRFDFIEIFFIKQRRQLERPPYHMQVIQVVVYTGVFSVQQMAQRGFSQAQVTAE